MPHFHGRADGATVRHHLIHAATIHRDRRSGSIGLAGTERQSCDLANARQSLTPKPERADAVKILGGPQLARGVGGDRQRQFIRLDATAVIDNADERDAPLFKVNINPRGSGVEGVFQEFLDDACRPLNDFAGGNSIHHRRRQFFDPWHCRLVTGSCDVGV